MADSSEEKITVTTPSSSTAGAIMDVQPPKNAGGVNPTSEVESSPVSVEPVASPAVVSSEPEVSVEQPVVVPEAAVTTSELTVESTPAPTASEPDPAPTPPAENPTSQGADNPMAIPTPATPKKSGGAPVAAIVVAIVIAIALAALTVFAYLKTKHTTSKTSNSSQAAPKLTATDIDQASQATDTTIKKVDDTKDFTTGDLTDQTLGL